MPRHSPYVITLSRHERDVLESRARKYTLPYFQVVRARMILSLPNTLFVFELLMLRPSVDTLPHHGAVPPFLARESARRGSTSSGPAGRSAGPAAPADGAPTLPSSSPPPACRRSAPVGLARASVDRVAIRIRDRQARDRHRLASARLPPLVDLEESRSTNSCDAFSCTSCRAVSCAFATSACSRIARVEAR